VLTVIGGWFFTAMMASTVAALFAVSLFFGGAPAVIAIVCLAVFMITRSHRVHTKREQAEDAMEVFNLRKIKDSAKSIDVTFQHAAIFLREVRGVLNAGFDGLFQLDRQRLRTARDGQKRIQQWSNIIAANTFKVLRLLQREEVESTQRYAQTISSLQEISESVRDIVLRSYQHVANNHSGLLEAQMAEMDRVRGCVVEILTKVGRALTHKEPADTKAIAALNRELHLLIHEYDQNQIMRIQDNSSKTRLSILFYSLTWDCLKISEQTTYLLSVFGEPLGLPSRQGLQPTTGRPDAQEPN
jgi:hypothetical protein